MSCQFGPDVTKAFLEENQLDYIIRSHEVKSEGYEVAHGGRCVTVFSAPNYWCVLLFPPLPGLQGLFVWIMSVWFLRPGLTVVQTGVKLMAFLLQASQVVGLQA